MSSNTWTDSQLTVSLFYFLYMFSRLWSSTM